MKTNYFHWEIKGRFRKRVVLANVPSFRFSFLGNIRRNHPFGNHPLVNTKKAHWEIKGRFLKGWFWRTYPRSGFRSGGTSAETTLLETTLLDSQFISVIVSGQMVGHPQTCVYPRVCIGIDYVSRKAPLLGQGHRGSSRYTKYLPCSPFKFFGKKVYLPKPDTLSWEGGFTRYIL